MKTFPTALAALLIAGAVQAQEADPHAQAPASGPICRVPAPRVPQVDWRGRAAYQATATAEGGRIVATEIRPLNGGVDRRSQRSLIQAITAALHAATCQPGHHVFGQRFDFTLGGADATAPAERPAPPDDADRELDETIAPAAHDCRVDPPQLPAAVVASPWRGQASYLSRANVQDGRVVRLSTRVLRRGVDADVQRELMAAVRAALTAAQCPPGRHVVEQRFDFDLRADLRTAP